MIKNDDGEVVSAKQWVVETCKNDLPLLTDYYYERYSHLWCRMTEKEKDEIGKHMDKIHNRIYDMLTKASKKSINSQNKT